MSHPPDDSSTNCWIQVYYLLIASEEDFLKTKSQYLVRGYIHYCCRIVLAKQRWMYKVLLVSKNSVSTMLPLPQVTPNWQPPMARTRRTIGFKKKTPNKHGDIWNSNGVILLLRRRLLFPQPQKLSIGIRRPTESCDAKGRKERNKQKICWRRFFSVKYILVNLKQDKNDDSIFLAS